MALAESQLSLNDHAALENYRRAMAIAETAAHPTDMYARWRLADAYSSIGQYHITFASHPSASSADRLARLREARVWLSKSPEVWDGWSRRGVSSVFNTSRRERAARALAQCDATINRLTALPAR
jgi:hypothetical protein